MEKYLTTKNDGKFDKHFSPNCKPEKNLLPVGHAEHLVSI